MAECKPDGAGMHDEQSAGTAVKLAPLCEALPGWMVAVQQRGCPNAGTHMGQLHIPSASVARQILTFAMSITCSEVNHQKQMPEV